jgi:hypothetical protein
LYNKVTEARITFTGKSLAKLAKYLDVGELTTDNYDNEFIVKAILHAMRDQHEVYDAAAGTALMRRESGDWRGWRQIGLGKSTSIIADTDPFYVLRHVKKEAEQDLWNGVFIKEKEMAQKAENAGEWVVSSLPVGLHPPGELVVTVTNMNDEEADKLGEELFSDKEDDSGD